MYIDLHGHSRKEDAFFYGCEPGTSYGAPMIEIREAPRRPTTNSVETSPKKSSPLDAAAMAAALGHQQQQPAATSAPPAPAPPPQEAPPQKQAAVLPVQVPVLSTPPVEVPAAVPVAVPAPATAAVVPVKSLGPNLPAGPATAMSFTTPRATTYSAEPKGPATPGKRETIPF